MKTLLFFLLIAFHGQTHAAASVTSSSGEYFLPTFPGEITRLPSADREREIDPATVRTIRVQVFPHVGKYTSPQKRDTVFTSVTLSANSGSCRMFRGPSTLPVDFELASGATPVKTARSFKLTYSSTPSPLWIECDGSVTLQRQSGLKAYAYAGSYFVARGRDSGKDVLRVVNVLPFEQYVKGVVPAEMPATWNPSAVRAQAIAARTYALRYVINRRARDDLAVAADIDVDDTVMYQAFLGETGRHPAGDAAVDATSGRFMTYEDRVITAYFSADSGGFTEDADHVWIGSNAPYCQAKREVYDPADVPGPWSVSFTYASLSEKLRAKGLIPAGATIDHLTIADWFPSGRANHLSAALRGHEHRSVEFLATDFAHAAGLSSTLFNLALRPTSVRIDGRGNGHGAGMSQWGAKALADGLSWNEEEILNFYYTGIAIR